MKYIQSSISSCPVCENQKITNVVNERYMLDENEPLVELSFLFCEQCDFVFQGNPLDEESIREYYKNVSSRLREAETSRTKRELRQRQFNFVVDCLEKEPRLILEIGADDGGFLTLCKKNWSSDTFFDEFNDKACSLLLKEGHRVHQKGNIYDFIVMLQVFEHIPEPKKFLENMKGNLNDNGLLLIEIPNHTYWDDNDYTFSLEHTNYFSSNSLLKLIVDTGYTLLNWQISTDLHYDSGNCRFIRCLIKKVEEPTTLKKIRRHYEQSKVTQFQKVHQFASLSAHTGKNIGFYGIGEVVRSIETVESLPDSISFFDSDESKHGVSFLGREIRSIEHLLVDNIDIVIVTCNVYAEVKERLLNSGYVGKVISWREV